jgi:nicotinate-nucleotide adenylyltransferase
MAQPKIPRARVGVSIKILYGGTFDPVHNGHVAIALAAQAAFNADVVLLPSADPPHRAPTSASALQRAEMLDLAIAGHAGLYSDRRELDRQGKSYSVLTLREVRAEIGPQRPLAWLIGSDAFSQIDAWHDWQDLFKLAHFIVVTRPQKANQHGSAALERFCKSRWQAHSQGLLGSPAGGLYRLPMAVRPESSTAIRGAMAATGPMNADLAPDVVAYIQRHHLYASAL